MKKVLAICGSTRTNSTNKNLLYAIAALSTNDFGMTIFEGLTELPHFNPDDDTDDVAKVVTNFRKALAESDGVIICTPEYAMGLPGGLKNMLDWTVSSSDFSKKPVLAITASSSGQKAHQSLLGTLAVIEAVINDDLQLLIPFAKTKINANNEVTDEKTLTELKRVLINFNHTMNTIGSNDEKAEIA